MSPTWSRWKVYDPYTADEWTFAMNPSEVVQPDQKKNVSSIGTTASDGRTIMYEGQKPPDELSWKGVILSRAERDIFLLWFAKPYQLRLTDDLGEEYWVYLDKFTPRRKRVVNRELKIEYDMHAFVLDIP